MDFEREKLVTLSNQQCVAIVEDGDDGGGDDGGGSRYVPDRRRGVCGGVDIDAEV